MQKPQLIFHIGAHKTGTTSIQHFCHRNYDLLVQQGVLYPKSLRIIDEGKVHFAHHDFAWHFGFANKPSRLKSPQTLLNKLIKEVESTKATKVFVSSESLEYSKSKQSIVELNNIFGDYFDIKVLMYIRRQDKMLESVYKQRVKTGLTADFKKFYKNNKINYLQVLNKWAKVFGDANIDLKVFDDKEVKLELLPNLLGYLGVQLTPKLHEETQLKRNESFTNFHTTLIAQLNEYTKGKYKNKIFNLFTDLYQNYQHEKEKGRWFTKREILKIIENYQTENEVIKNRFLPQRETLFRFDEATEFEKFLLFKEEKINPQIMDVLVYTLKHTKPEKH